MKSCLVVIQNLTKSGSPQTFLHVIEALKKEGFVVDTYAYSVFDDKADLAMLKAYQDVCRNIYFNKINGNSLLYRFFPFLLLSSIKKLIKKGQYDMFLTNNFYISAYVAKKEYGKIKNVYYSLGNVNQKSKYWIFRRKDIYIKKLVTKVDAYIGISNLAFFDDIEVDSNKKFVLMDSPNNYYPNIVKDNNRDLTIGQIGYFSENKNQLFTIELFNKVKECFPNATLLFVGYQSSDEPNYIEEVKKRVADLGLSNSVSFLPPNYDKEALFKQIDVLLLPSFLEGLPISLMEAQFSNTPCIASEFISSDADFGLLKRLPLNTDEWLKEIRNTDYKIPRRPKYIYTSEEFEKRIKYIIDYVFKSSSQS